MAAPIRVALVDDHGLCRKGLAELLEHHAGVTVVGATGMPEDAIAILKQHRPDLVIIDLKMSPMPGLPMLKRFREEGIDTPAMVLTMSDSQDDLANALRAGVRGYLLKDMDPDDVVDSVRRVLHGELVVAPAMAVKLANLLDGGQHGTAKGRSLKSLTGREREILEHLSKGKSNKAIAQALEISSDTVKLHVRHILSKLNLSSRVEAAVYAVEQRVADSSSGN